LPLSATLCLAFVSPKFAERVREMVQYVDANPDYPHSITPSRDYLQSLDGGSPLALDPEFVINLNSEQVLGAERFVYAPESRFEMVEAMIAEDEHARVGPRLSGGRDGLS
jgi:hypothetical protein